ncbi:MAG: hypothetical protein RI897_4081 [Verrucomicrobiota bacterium]|jgi:hypothetical protein
MVTKRACFGGRRGYINADAVVGLSILVLALMPLTLTLFPQQKVALAAYERAVVMEVLDGELEVLRAGAWREFGVGEHVYPVRAEAAASLPSGRFVLEVREGVLRLEWRAEATPVRKRLPIAREVRL